MDETIKQQPKPGSHSGYKARRLRLLAKYNYKNGSLLAKGLGFSLVFGSLPLLFLGLSLSAYIYNVTPDLQSFISRNILDFLPLEMRSTLLSQIMRLTRRWGSLGLMTLLAFIVTSITVFDSLEGAMSAMLSGSRRKFHYGRLISLALMLGVLLLFYLSSALSLTAQYFRQSRSFPPWLVYWGGKLASGLIIALVLLGLYHLFARRTLRFRPTLAIACLSALVWQLIVVIGAKIVRYAGTRFLVYGVIAWAVIFLLFMRLLAELIVISSLLVDHFSPPDKSSPRA